MVKSILAGLEIPSVRHELIAHSRRPRSGVTDDRLRPSHAKGSIVLERRSVPLPYPIGSTTLQVNGLHLRLVPTGAKSSDGSTGKGRKGDGGRSSHDGRQGGSDEDTTVSVNVVVKLQMTSGLGGESPAQEFVAAVVPLKYSSLPHPSNANNSSNNDVGGGFASSPALKGRHGGQSYLQQGKAPADAVASKYLSSTGHLPFDKRKLNAMRREQQAHTAAVIGTRTAIDDDEDDELCKVAPVSGRKKAISSNANGSSTQQPASPWLSAAVGPEAFARLDVRVQMERVRVVVEVHPLVERVKRPRQEPHHAHDNQKGYGGSVQDCRLEVCVIGTISSLV